MDGDFMALFFLGFAIIVSGAIIISMWITTHSGILNAQYIEIAELKTKLSELSKRLERFENQI